MRSSCLSDGKADSARQLQLLLLVVVLEGDQPLALRLQFDLGAQNVDGRQQTGILAVERPGCRRLRPRTPGPSPLRCGWRPIPPACRARSPRAQRSRGRPGRKTPPPCAFCTLARESFKELKSKIDLRNRAAGVEHAERADDLLNSRKTRKPERRQVVLLRRLPDQRPHLGQTACSAPPGAGRARRARPSLLSTAP